MMVRSDLCVDHTGEKLVSDWIWPKTIHIQR